jgi:hypothetical protein
VIEKAELIVKLSMPKSWDVEIARPILISDADPSKPDVKVLD